MEQKKKKRGFRWLFLGLVLGVLIFTAFYFAGRFGINQHFLPTQNQAQWFMQDTFQKGKEVAGNFNGQSFGERSGMRHAGMGHGPAFGGPGEMMGRHHGFHGHHGFGFGGFFVVLGGLALALIGLYVRRKGEKKWLGNGLILLGILPLLAKLPILPLLVIGILAYWFIKKFQSKKAEAAIPVSFQPDYSMNGQFLDEWERTNTKEEK